MNYWLIRRLSNLLRATRATAIRRGLSIGLILLCGSITTASAQEETEYIPILTPEAAQVFAARPDVSVQIPEVYELLTTAIALANIEDFLGDLIPEGESSDGFMIDKSTPYYQELETQFGGFRDHPLIVQIREAYQPLIESLDILGLLVYRNQSLGYRFDEDGKIVSTGLYIPLNGASLSKIPDFKALTTSFPFNVDDPETLSLLEDFAEQTGFRQFYAEHQDYYNAQTTLAADLCDAAAARDWLMAQFPAAYTNHTIVLSPLMGGTHNFLSVGTSDGSITQALMFVPIFSGKGKAAADVPVQEQAEYCRFSFTEIDHGYVNPATDLYTAEVNEAMPDIIPWNSIQLNQESYPTPYETFNEYMTFAAYTLFLSETLPEEDQEAAIQAIEDFMIDTRGFTKFREFNQELLRLYQERAEGQTVTDLYPAVLEWVAAQK